METKKNKKTSLKIIFLLFLAVGIVISFLPFGKFDVWHNAFSFFGLNDFSAVTDKSPFAIHVLEVGKADSIFIESNGKYMLVDGGTSDCGEKIYEYLYRKGVNHLDCVVNTHPDNDHIGGLAYIIKNLEVKKYYRSDFLVNSAYKNDEYIEVQKVLKEKNVPEETLSFGKSFNLGNTKIDVVAPIKQSNNSNNNSVVMKLTYGDTSFLLMGDAEKEEEMDIIKSKADISSDFIKIGHHGSSTSTSAPLLNVVNPKYAAISVSDDTNNLPKKDILKRLIAKNIKIYRTDVNGTLIFMSDGKKISVKTRR